MAEPSPASAARHPALPSGDDFRALFTASLDALLVTEPDGGILAANAAACRLFDRTEEELRRIGRNGVVDTSDPRLAAALAERARTGRFHGIIGLVHRDGTRFEGEVSTAVFRDVSGALRTSMVIRDVTERLRYERALVQADQFRHATLDALTVHLCVIDEAGTILLVNQAWRDFAAANDLRLPGAGRGLNYLAVCDAAAGPDAAIAAEFARGLRAILRGAQASFELEYPCHSPGTPRWFVGRATGFSEDAGRRAVVVHADITARKLAEMALQASEARFRSVVEDQTEVICRFQADGTFTFVNDVYCRLFGKSRAELIGRRWQPKALAEDLPHITAQLATLSPAHPVVVIENRAHTQPGGVRWMQWINRGFFDDTGRLREIQAVGRDIHERKQVELEHHAAREQLRALAARLQVVREEERTMVAREIHDVLAQDLTRLKIDLVWLQRRLEEARSSLPRRSLAARVAEMSQATDAVICSVQRLATGLRPAVLDAFGLCAAVEWQTRDFESHVGIRCALHLPAEEPPLDRAAATAAFRILQESLTNVARHAHATEVVVEMQQADRQLILRIHDNGCGISPGALLTPISIGLAGMRERAQLLGGILTIDGVTDGGTTVELRLPLGGAEASRPPHEDSAR
ncbi:MAG: PAS domain S-box protein [Verrucomicrobia bacterium]|nr:PAS domain S-box protein [Verrucomicrobiota bacterium]